MLRRVDLRDAGVPDPAAVRELLPRAALDVPAAVAVVEPIVVAVRDRGAAAVREATARLDGVDVTDLRVPPAALAEARDGLDPDLRAAMEESAARATEAHRAQLPAEVTTALAPGGTVTQTWRPVARAGVYVPGGANTLPSSVIMNVAPARVAGVEEIAVASPPRRLTGLPEPAVLAACALLGVDEVYAMGGAQAIAALAYGISGVCRPVDLVTGPGSVYTNAAKRLVRGAVEVDAEAGPSEVAVLADGTADPALVAADLVSQAEHGELSAAVLVTPAESLVDGVERELARQVAAAKHRERVAAALAGRQSAAVLVADLAAGLAVVDAYAAEHLEIQTRDAADLARRVRHAGAIFVGPHAPVSLGDYCAGSNHVLPTGGGARHTGGLSVHTFLRGVQVVAYDRAALAAVAPRVVAFAESEDLPAHGYAVAARLS